MSSNDSMVSPAETANNGSATPQSSSATKPAETDPTLNTRRCFVCLTDEPDNELPKDWSTPCRCSLEGHQECLLDWVADLESQQKAVACPQCKSKIRVDDRFDAIIQVSQIFNKVMSDWSVTVLLGFAGSGTLVASAFYGLEAIQIFAGPDLAKDFIVRPVPENPLPPFVQSTIEKIWPQAAQSCKWALQTVPDVKLGNLCLLPLIGPGLVLNRFNLGGFLVVPPSIFVIPHAAAWMYLGDPELQPQTWPPSFEQAMLFYPAIKSTYFYLYKKFAGPWESKWDAMSKRWTLQEENQNEDDDDGEGENHGRAPVPNPPPPADDDLHQGGGHFQMELELGVGFGGGADNIAIEAGAAGVNDNNEDNANANANGNGNANERENAAAAAPPPQRQQRLLEIGDREPFNFLAGALLYPVVCYGMGEVLRAVLPRRLVSRPVAGAALTGLLQEQWGRSLVGGCLFVVLKDAFYLYVKYRRAMNRPHRRIRNVKDRAVNP